MQMRPVKRLTLAGLFACLVSTHLYAQDMPPAQVEVARLEAISLAPSIQLKGNVISLQDAVLSSEVEGQLEDILFVGTQVEKGQRLAQINNEKSEWQLLREEAKLAGLVTDFNFRQSEVERFKVLASQDNASKTQLQRELASKQMLEQQILSAKADVAEAKRALNDSSIKAPFSGVLAQRHAQLGEFIRIGDPIARLVNQSLIDISVPAPIRHQDLLSSGMLVRVNYHNGQLTLPIRQVVSIGDPNSRMVEVRLDASDSGLLVGDSVTVFLPKALPSIEVAIPRDALVIKGSQTYIYLVDSESKAQQVSVNVRYADGPWVVLDGDVKPNDLVVIRGAERLQPDSMVSVIK